MFCLVGFIKDEGSGRRRAVGRPPGAPGARSRTRVELGSPGRVAKNRPSGQPRVTRCSTSHSDYFKRFPFPLNLYSCLLCPPSSSPADLITAGALRPRSSWLGVTLPPPPLTDFGSLCFPPWLGDTFLTARASAVWPEYILLNANQIVLFPPSEPLKAALHS